MDNEQLISASYKGDIEKVKKLIASGFPLDKTTSDGKTALIIASSENHPEIVKLLIDAKTKINTTDDNGNTALIIATSKCHRDVIKILIDAGADPDIRNDDGNTALIIAIKNDCKYVIELFIDAGANLNIRDVDGRTALIIAIILGQEANSKLLIHAGANLNIFDHNEKNALTYARQNNKKLFQMLMKVGAGTIEMSIPMGEGSFGSVYDGALKCEGKDIPDKCKKENCVTKKFRDDKEFESELKRVEKIEKVDSEGIYHFPIRGYCPPSVNRGMIYYEKGEKTLGKILSEIIKTKSHEIYREMMRKIVRLFDGLIFFNRTNFVHCDIKPDNIVEGADGKIKYIDFGLSQDMNKFVPDINLLTPKYFRPPEIIYFSVSEYYNFDDFIQKYSRMYISQFKQISALKRSGIWPKFGEEEIEELKKYLINIGGNSPEKISKKIDVFSLGILLTNILDVAKLLEKTGIDTLTKICEKMTKFNQDQRYTAEEARGHYEKYLEEIR